MRKLMETVEKLDEGYFSRLATELDELYRANPNTPDANLVAFVKRKYGEEAADFFRSQIESGEYEQSLEETNDRYDPDTYECVHCGDYHCESKFGGECPKIQRDMFDESWPQEETWDEMVEYWKQSLSSSIVSKGVFTQMYDAAGQDIDELNAAIADQAESIADSYHGSGEGIGTSDQNHFVASIARSLGIDDVFGWRKPKESNNIRDLEGLDKHLALAHGMASDEEMERDKAVRGMKASKATRNAESIEEGIVKVPRGLRGEEGNPLGLTSKDAEAFINSLGPDDVVATEVVDPETGEVLDWPDQGTRRERNRKEWDREEKSRKSAEEDDYEKGYDAPYLYVGGLDKDPERAWEGIETLKYDREFTDFYNIVWKSVEDLVDDPDSYYEGDYDIGIDIPVAIKRKDGKKFNKQDRQNFDQISKIFRAATHNIAVQYVGSSNEGTVARFIPNFM